MKKWLWILLCLVLCLQPLSSVSAKEQEQAADMAEASVVSENKELPAAEMQASAEDFAGAADIVPGVETQAVIETGGEEVYFRFIPEAEGNYAFT